MGVKHSIPSKLSCAGVMQELQTVAEQIIGILILQVRSNEIYKLGYCSSRTDIREMSQGYSQIRFLSSFFSFWLQRLVEQNIIMMDFGQFA